jgi:hypothetical protein
MLTIRITGSSKMMNDYRKQEEINGHAMFTPFIRNVIPSLFVKNIEL